MSPIAKVLEDLKHVLTVLEDSPTDARTLLAGLRKSIASRGLTPGLMEQVADTLDQSLNMLDGGVTGGYEASRILLGLCRELEAQSNRPRTAREEAPVDPARTRALRPLPASIQNAIREGKSPPAISQGCGAAHPAPQPDADAVRTVERTPNGHRSRVITLAVFATIVVVSGGIGWFLFSKGSSSSSGTGTTASHEKDTPNSADPAAIFRQASPSVVWVLTSDEHGRLLGSGSGFFVSKDGHIATNYHVVQDAWGVHIVLADKTRVKVLGATAIDEGADIAILKVPPERSGPPLPLANAELPVVGSKVFAIGNPKGLTHTLSEGLVSGHRELGRIRLIQTTAPISPGSSGGPLLGADGKAVGVTSAGLDDGQNLNFAVPISQVQRLLLHADTIVLPFAPNAAELERIVGQFSEAGASMSRTPAGKITSISFDKARLADLDLRVLRYFPDTTEVFLRNRDVNDDTVAQLAGSKIERLHLVTSRIGDDGVRHLRRLRNLKLVPMGWTRVTDNGLIHLRGLTQLEYVGLRGDAITDAGLAHLAGLKNLQGLDLRQTRVTNAGLFHLRGMTKMTALFLADAISDQGLDDLKGMSNLQFLDVTGTKVTENGLASFRKRRPTLRIIR